MADLKISQLTAISVLTPATDVLPVVDVGGVTKKISTNQILASGGVASLASATITGDLTVDTSTLKVDSTNNRVGVGTATPSATLHVSSSGSVHVNQRTGGNGCFTQYIDPTSSNYVGSDSGNFRLSNNSAQDLLNIQQLGVFTFGDGAGGTRMTLNSTGLGIGISPAYKFHAVVTSGAVGAFRATTAAIARLLVGNTVEDVELKVNANGDGQLTANASKYLGLGSGGINDRVVLDTSGNLLVGLATAGTTAAKTIQIANGTAPTANVTGGQLYVESGALKFRGSSGTITTIAAA